MSSWKKIAIFVFLVLIAFCLSACQQSAETSNAGNYRQAVELLAEGKNPEAASLLDSSGSFEEATMLSMYRKAVETGDNGDYQSALTTFRNLGGYLDSELMIAYYTARSEMLLAGQKGYEPAQQYVKAAGILLANPLFRDSKELADTCYSSAYEYAKELASQKNYYQAINDFELLGDYLDSPALAKQAGADSYYDAGDLASAWEIYRNLGAAYQTHASDYAANYMAANEQKENGKYKEAAAGFERLGDYEDSKSLRNECTYLYAKDLMDKKEFDSASTVFASLGEYKDSGTLSSECRYLQAKDLMENKEYESASRIFASLGEYKDSGTLSSECKYLQAKDLMGNKEFENARSVFANLGKYKDSSILVSECRYLQAKKWMADGENEKAAALFEEVAEYKDSASLIGQINADDLFSKGKLADAWEIYAGLDDQYRTNEAEYEEQYLAAAGELENLKYDIARSHFQKLGSYKDSKEQAVKCFTDKAEAYLADGEYLKAIDVFKSLGEKEKISECHYLYAGKLHSEEKYVSAAFEYGQCMDYKDSASKHFEMGMACYETGLLQQAIEILKTDPDTEAAKEAIYQIAVTATEKEEYDISTKAYEFVGEYKEALLARLKDYYRWGNKLYELGDYDGSADVFASLGDFSTAPAKVKLAGYTAAVKKMDEGEYAAAKEYLNSLGEYEDSIELLKKCDYELTAELYRAGKYQLALDTFTKKELAGYEQANEMMDDCHYYLGLEAEEQGSFLDAINEFNSANGCRDSADHVLECTYLQAVSLKESGKLGPAVDWFIKAEKHPMTNGQIESILDYCVVTEQDESADYLKQVLALIHANKALDEGRSKEALDLFGQVTETSISKAREKEAWFRYGETLFAEEKYPDAIEAFTKAGDYEGAKASLKEAWIAEAEKYVSDKKFAEARAAYKEAGIKDRILEVWGLEGEEELLNGNYEKAKAAFKNARNQERYDDTVFAEANDLMNQEKYTEAYSLLTTIDYRDDVKEFIAQNSSTFDDMMVKKGAVIQFGKHEWIIVKKNPKIMLLVSRGSVAERSYIQSMYKASRVVTWETSPIREWLNNTFLKNNFSKEERSAIMYIKVDNSRGQGYIGWNTDGGADTWDKVFLLSYKEADEYFGFGDGSAKGSSGYPIELKGRSWLLRSPGKKNTEIAWVNQEGRLVSYPSSMIASIRPAIWVMVDYFINR